MPATFVGICLPLVSIPVCAWILYWCVSVFRIFAAPSWYFFPFSASLSASGTFSTRIKFCYLKKKLD